MRTVAAVAIAVPLLLLSQRFTIAQFESLQSYMAQCIETIPECSVIQYNYCYRDADSQIEEKLDEFEKHENKPTFEGCTDWYSSQVSCRFTNETDVIHVPKRTGECLMSSSLAFYQAEIAITVVPFRNASNLLSVELPSKLTLGLLTLFSSDPYHPGKLKVNLTNQSQWKRTELYAITEANWYGAVSALKSIVQAESICLTRFYAFVISPTNISNERTEIPNEFESILSKVFCGNGSNSDVIITNVNVTRMSICNFRHLRLKTLAFQVTESGVGGSFTVCEEAFFNSSIDYFLIDNAFHVENHAFSRVQIGKLLSLTLAAQESSIRRPNLPLAENAFQDINFASIHPYQLTRLRIDCNSLLQHEPNRVPDLSDIALTTAKLTLIKCAELSKRLHYSGEDSPINLTFYLDYNSTTLVNRTELLYNLDDSLNPKGLNLNSLVIVTPQYEYDNNARSPGMFIQAITYNASVCVTKRSIRVKHLVYYGQICAETLLAFAAQLEVIHIAQAKYLPGKLNLKETLLLLSINKKEFYDINVLKLFISILMASVVLKCFNCASRYDA